MKIKLDKKKDKPINKYLSIRLVNCHEYKNDLY